MRKLLLAVAFGFFFTATTFADSIAPLPGVNLCELYNICGTPTTIEVELGGIGTNTWTDLIELSPVYQPESFCFSGGTCLPPGSIWAKFLYPNGNVGLSSPLTWRPDPPDSNTTVPEPSTLFLLATGLASLVPIVLRARHRDTD